MRAMLTLVFVVLAHSVAAAQTVPAPRFPDVIQLSADRSDFNGLFPIRNAKDAEVFWGTDGVSTVGRVLLSGSSDSASLYAEVIATNIEMVHVMIGSTISAAKDNTTAAPMSLSKEDLQRFLGGGGTATLTAGYPVYFRHSASQPNVRYAGVYALPRLAVDIPSIGQSSNDFRLNFDVGAEAHACFGNDDIAFFGLSRLAYVAANNKFTDSIGASDDFGYWRVAVGVRVRGLIDIGGTYTDFFGAAFGESLNSSEKWQVYAAFTPGQKK